MIIIAPNVILPHFPLRGQKTPKYKQNHGDHSYEGGKNDFQKFGRRMRLGGAVLFDDAFDEGLFKTHVNTEGRLVQEVISEGEFRLARAVNRLSHLDKDQVIL